MNNVKNKLSDLRNHLFETIERLKDEDKDKAMEVERAKAVAQVASVIIESAKVELKALDMVDAKPSEFLELAEGEGERFLPEFPGQRRPTRRGLSTGKNLGTPS